MGPCGGGGGGGGIAGGGGGGTAGGGDGGGEGGGDVKGGGGANRGPSACMPCREPGMGHFSGSDQVLGFQKTYQIKLRNSWIA